MHGRQPHAPPRRTRREVEPTGDRRVLMVTVVAAAVAAGAIVLTGGGGESTTITAAPTAAAPVALAVQAQSGAVEAGATGDAVDTGTAGSTADAAGAVDLDGCQLDIPSVAIGDEGPAVECAQKALWAAGYYTGEVSGVFDDATRDAALAFQAYHGLYPDGIVGANTAEALGIWPGAQSFVVRTPAPVDGAVDLWGNPLSSVASAGDDAPPMPPDSGQGTGKRVVYDRTGQRVWAVDGDERVVRSYLVTGSQYANEVPGVHRVYSKSEMSTAWNFEAELPLMVRYLKTERGAIGFHAIPSRNDTGEPYQTEAELGQKMSGGCQRQALLDAQFMWAFADIGTRVVVT